jgi:uncharacterized protein YqgQ
VFAEKYITASCVISNHLILKNGKTIFENKHADLHDFLLSAYNYFGLNYPKFYKMDNLSKLGWLASEILLRDNFRPEKYRPDETGLVLANANSSLDTDLKYFETAKDIPSPSVFVYTLPNIMIGEICIRNNFKGENAFFVSDKFDADFMEQYVSNLFNNNILQACISGWVDLLEEDYKAVLFLIEKEKSEQSSLLTQDNINKIFKAING